jgi:heterodisulfide reductase subunit C
VEVHNSSTPATFAAQVRSVPGGEHLDMCYSCGTCVSRCLIQQKLEPEYNPRRLLYMVMMDMRAEAYQSPTTWLCSACDLCFPACPQKIHISCVITAVKELAAPVISINPFILTAVVNEATCVACGLCVEVCPYDAVVLEEKTVAYRGKIKVAKVDATKCMSCGLCAAGCRSTSIELVETYGNDRVIDDIWSWFEQENVK